MNIRPITIDDAADYLEMLRQLDTETRFMLFEAGEWNTTEQEMRVKIGEVIRSGSLTLVAEMDGKMAGFLSAERGFANRTRHSAYVVIGILKDYRGRRIGKELFEELERWAAGNGVTRLELTVMTHNEQGIRLYRSMGFETEGVKVKSLKVGGNYVDEYYMAKLLE